MDNYAASVEKTKKLFLGYPQEDMIAAFALEHDNDYMYLSFMGRKERVSRATASIEFESCGVWTESSYAEYMTIYDVLSRCSMPRLTGEMVPASALLGSAYRSGISDFFEREAMLLDERFDDLKRVCACTGEITEGMSDLECTFSLFEFLPVGMRFLRADDEFPPEIHYLWDGCTLKHMYFETTQFCERFITDMLIKEIKKGS